MTNILIGSSNIARFYQAQNFSRFRPYTLARCTEFSSFTAIMGESTDKHFVISVIENFVSDCMKGSTVESVDKVMEDVARDFLDVIRAASIRLPESKFGVVMPLQRPSLPWYQDELLTLRDMLERGLINLKLNNVTRIDCISTLTQTFVDDQIHLTKASGKGFVTFILSQAEVFFYSTSILLTLQSSPHRTPPPTAPSITQRVDQLEAAFRTRNISDNLVLDRIREEIDATANRSKEDHVVINGLVVKQPLPAEI
jgi:hypothetical protein